MLSFGAPLPPRLPPPPCRVLLSKPGRTVKIKAIVDGTELFVKDTGGAGRAVVMTHAWPLNADVWDHQAAQPVPASASSP